MGSLHRPPTTPGHSLLLLFPSSASPATIPQQSEQSLLEPRESTEGIMTFQHYIVQRVYSITIYTHRDPYGGEGFGVF